MSAPLYFLPGIFAAQLLPGGTLNRRLLADRGLADVLADVEAAGLAHHEIAAAAGPGGKPGMIVCARPGEGVPLPRRLGYYPDDPHVTWHTLRGGDLYLAIDATSPPGPEDLLRRDPLGGQAVRLGDGREWQVPVIRCPIGGTQLPQSIGWHDGALGLQVKPAYRDLWDRSLAAADFAFVSGTISYEVGAALAVDVLALNYRLGRDELTLLGLLDTLNIEHVLHAMVDYAKVKAFNVERKKKAGSSLSVDAS